MKKSEISYVIVPCSNWKVLLIESAGTAFPEIINANVEHLFLFLESVNRPVNAFEKCL